MINYLHLGVKLPKESIAFLFVYKSHRAYHFPLLNRVIYHLKISYSYLFTYIIFKDSILAWDIPNTSISQEPLFTCLPVLLPQIDLYVEFKTIIDGNIFAYWSVIICHNHLAKRRQKLLNSKSFKQTLSGTKDFYKITRR